MVPDTSALEVSALETNDELRVQQAEIHAGPFAHVSNQARLEAATAMRNVAGIYGATSGGALETGRGLQGQRTANEKHSAAAVESESSSDDESDSDSEPQTLTQELATRMGHTVSLSAREQMRHRTPLRDEFYSEEGMTTRIELLEKENIKQALENLWAAANCVHPTDKVIDKQELASPLTLALSLSLILTRDVIDTRRQALVPTLSSPNPNPSPTLALALAHAPRRVGVCDYASQDRPAPAADGDADRGDGCL